MSQAIKLSAVVGNYFLYYKVIISIMYYISLRNYEKQRMQEYLQELQEMEERVNQRPLLLERATQVVLYYVLILSSNDA